MLEKLKVRTGMLLVLFCFVTAWRSLAGWAGLMPSAASRK